jgi:hypothetical protein
MMNTLSAQRIATILCAFVVLLFAACGDDDGDGNGNHDGDNGNGNGSGELRYDPDKGDDIAHAAMISHRDLGRDWQTAATDDFREQDLGNTTACRAAQRRIDEDEREVERDRAGRAQKQFSLAGSSGIPATATISVAVYESDETPELALDAFRDALDNVRDCFKETLAANLPADAEIEIEDASETVDVPSDGISAAWDYTIDAGSQTIRYHVEAYVWTDSNAGVSIVFAGGQADLEEEAIKTAVEETNTRLDREAS